MNDVTRCRKCKSDDLEYWDNVEMTSETFNWGYYCNTCKEYIDPYDDIEIYENGSK